MTRPTERHIPHSKGGHLEPSDNTLLQAVGRELAEETGIPPHMVTHTARPRSTSTSTPSTPTPPRTSPPTSFDFRFLFRTTADIGGLQTEEVSDAAWRHVDEITDPKLRDRISAVDSSTPG
ncbi:NUDIX hydrolase [Streptomyces sp. NPDC047515]|uniref:NUDIX hydrolase n=1 Tax=Streptomyces sp. NPDC047515 TaxID=3155380 RepID=UPI0033C58F57